MESIKGNIMNRKPKQVRDANYSLHDYQVALQQSAVSFKQQKIDEVTKHRKMAILGNQEEKV